MILPEKYKGLAYLVLLLLVVPLAAWQLAFSGTVFSLSSANKLSRDIIILKEQAEQYSGEADNPDITGQRIKEGELLTGILGSDGITGCEVIKFTPYITGKSDGLKVYTTEIILAGKYTDLIRVIDRTEREIKSCKLLSVTFRSVKPRNREELQLQAVLVLQQFTEEE